MEQAERAKGVAVRVGYEYKADGTIVSYLVPEDSKLPWRQPEEAVAFDYETWGGTLTGRLSSRMPNNMSMGAKVRGRRGIGKPSTFGMRFGAGKNPIRDMPWTRPYELPETPLENMDRGFPLNLARLDLRGLR